MTTRPTLFALLPLVLCAGVSAQDSQDGKRELRETQFFDGKVTFSTRDGERTVRMTLKQFQLDGEARAEVPLPDKGMVLLQHRAGDMELITGQTEFEPIEGEWMTVDLPERVMLSTEDDTALVDAIVISE